MKIVETVYAGVIDDAPTFAEVGGNIAGFMTKIFGTAAIIGLAVAAILYFTANGDEGKIALAKKSFFYSVVGIIVGLGAIVIITQVANFFK